MNKVEVTFWRAHSIKAIRIGHWDAGVFRTVAKVPVHGSEYTDAEAATAYRLAKEIAT